MFFQEGSRDPANHLAQPGSEEAKQMTDTYGLKCGEQLEKYSRASLWLKTLLDFSPFWSQRVYLRWKVKRYSFLVKAKVTKSMKLLKEFNEELSPQLLKKSGQKDIYYPHLKMEHQSFAVFQLVPQTPRTEGIGFGLLPTPTVAETIEPKEARTVFGNNRVKSNQGIEGQCKLTDLAMNGLLPTPCVLEGSRKLTNGKNLSAKGMKYGITLTQSVKVLTNNIESTSSTSQLNPQFVGEMMGYPVNWLELPYQSIEQNL